MTTTANVPERMDKPWFSLYESVITHYGAVFEAKKPAPQHQAQTIVAHRRYLLTQPQLRTRGATLDQRTDDSINLHLFIID
jgi:hypothetical protein